MSSGFVFIYAKKMEFNLLPFGSSENDPSDTIAAPTTHHGWLRIHRKIVLQVCPLTGAGRNATKGGDNCW
jgi:hypothetical protein